MRKTQGNPLFPKQTSLLENLQPNQVMKAISPKTALKSRYHFNNKRILVEDNTHSQKVIPRHDFKAPTVCSGGKINPRSIPEGISEPIS